MPATYPPGSRITCAGVDASLPPTFFVRRGHIRAAFGLSEEQLAALVPSVFQPRYLPPNQRPRGRQKRRARSSRAVFVRTQVLAVARQWEGAA